MRFDSRGLSFLFLVTWCLALTLPARVLAVVTIADTGAFVIDTAHVIEPATRERMQNLLKELEQKTTDQVKVLTLETTDGEAIFSFAQRHYELWKLGQKRKSNGALVVFALKDRRIRIHTGYGLEGSLPDTWNGTLIREIEREYFKPGRYSEGLYQLTVSVVNKVATDENVTIAGLPKARIMPRRPGPQNGMQVFALLLPLGVMALIIWYRIRRQRHRSLWGGIAGRGVGWWDDMFRGGGGPWSGGGGFGGGFDGGGSFGGGGGSFGGGGSSGGGGAEGSW